MIKRLSALALIAGAFATNGHAQQTKGDAATELAKQTQNPVASLVSVPLQSNFNIHTGPFNRLQYEGLLQPVVPLGLTDEWNVIVQPIIPFVGQPVGASSSTFGLGDIALQTYFTPQHTGNVIWGVGPIGQFPTRTAPVLGEGMWGAGLGGVALVQPGPWVIGTLLNHVWSIGSPGPDQQAFSLTTIQPFINYNFGHGTAIAFTSQMTRDGAQPEGQQWTVPLGGQVSQILPIGHQPIQLSAGAFYNVARPSGVSDWQVRFQVTLLFPK